MQELILRHPGPTPIPKRVELAMQQPIFSHRSKEFQELYATVAEQSKMFFGTKNELIFLPSAGTAALEAACLNVLQPHDEIVIVSVGFFGDYFVEICQKLNVKIHLLKKEYGEGCSPEELAKFLKPLSTIKAVFLTYNETSTGVINPIKELASCIKEHSDALIIVDGVSCIGAVNCQMDEWGLDIVVTGSQKALMLPPGLAILAISDKAWSVIRKNNVPSYYLNLEKYEQWAQNHMTPNTPAITLFTGLKAVCELVEEEGGLEKVIQRHEMTKNMTRRGLEALGFSMLVEEKYASPTVTTIYTPAPYETSEFIHHLKSNYHIDFAGALGPISKTVFRFGHMGYCFPSDVLQALSYIEAACLDLKIPIQEGSSLVAAQKQFLMR